MKRLPVAVFVLTALQVPPTLSAAGAMLKITIKGGGLAQPIEIAGQEQRAKFSIGGGPGTGCGLPDRPVSPVCQAILQRSYSRSFIVDWSKGVIDAPREGLVNYEVEFLMSRPGPMNTYRVSYAYDPVKQGGFVYIPGKDDPRHNENVWLIIRGVEGNWYHAWSDWDAVATALLQATRH